MPAIEVGHSWIDVLVAVLVLIAVIAPSVFAFFAAKHAKVVRSDVEGVKQDLATNHGKKPFEYLEMVADVREAQIESRLDQLAMKKLLIDHAEALTDHTSQDEHNFAELKRLIGEND